MCYMDFPGTGTKKMLTKRSQLSRSLSQADKENLKRSNISHLPLSKQKEYKRLLKLLAMKEQSKKRLKINSVIVEKSKISVQPPAALLQHPVKKSDSNSPNSSTQATDVKKAQIDKPTAMPAKANQMLRGITVSISDNKKRDVQVKDEPEKTLALMLKTRNI